MASTNATFQNSPYSPSQRYQFEVEFQPESSREEGDIESAEGTDSFRPHYYPKRCVLDKERDIVREKGICDNEYVNDIGGKNREIHAEGFLTSNELEDFHKLCDFGRKCYAFTMQWEGEVLLADSSLEGPEGIDAHSGLWMYKYTLQLLSTGRDELGAAGSGIENAGSD